MDERRMTATASATPPGSTSGGGSPTPELASIKVYCRLRQQNQLEKREEAVQCTTVVGGRTMYLRNERCEVDEIRCTFDRVFDINSTQEEVYTHSAKPLVQEFLQGYNCTIFAYGQTGSGKTHTILGPKDGVLVSADEEGGIISRVAKDLYQEVENAKTDPIELTVSFVEIYMEQIRDLLSPSSTSGNIGTPANGGLKIRESAQHGVYVEEMTRIPSKSEAAMMELVKSGTLSRAVSSTRMNKDSSRSHTILMISCVRPVSGRRATMYIVDLAGSELVNKTNASGRVLQEAKAINKSLSALSNVIKALGEGKRHVPYRDSKLTRLLQDSLGGTAKTCLILAASCSSYNMAETISTLRFGLRAKEIKNPVIQRTDGGEGPGFATGIIFKELYQRAMEDMEAKNRKIDELQRLLTAKYQENQHPDDGDASGGVTAASGQESSKSQDSDTSDGSQEGDDDDSDSADNDEEENDPAQTDAKNVTKLELANQALEEENKRLFGVLEALEKKLDEVTVDLSTGRPILTLSKRSKSSTEEDDASANESREAAAPSLKVWLESDNWRKSLEARLEESGDKVLPVPASTVDGLAASAVVLTEAAHESLKAPSPLKEILASSPPSFQGAVGKCSTPDCVHHADAEALSRQIVELKLQLHYLSENARLSLSGESYNIMVENARLKTRIEELEFQANLCNVACSQLEMKNRACETRLSNQETHIGCLQNSLQEYQGLFKQQIIMSQEKCRLLTDELEFYKKLARCSQESYQHLGGGASPGRRNKAGRSPSPRKSAASSTPSLSTLAGEAADSNSSAAVWPGFSPSSSSRSGGDSAELTLSARAQRFIVKPMGERAADEPSLSLDELARAATPSSLQY